MLRTRRTGTSSESALLVTPRTLVSSVISSGIESWQPPEGAKMQREIHRVEVRNGRSGSTHGYSFTGWEYQEGWLITFWLIGRDPVRTIWVDSPTTFYAVPRMQLGGQRVIEINPEPIELTAEEKDAIISMVWQWKILE